MLLRGGDAVEHYPFVNLPLGYGFDALEPYIDEATMRVHYEGHLANYISSLNSALEKCPALQNLPLCTLASSPRAPEAVRRSAGGVLNHRLYFDCMNPYRKEPELSLAGDIRRQFGSAERFWSEFVSAAMSVFGSGYAFLIRRNGSLCVVTAANQTVPPGELLLCVDVWEHAYYLKHQNRRADYIAAWRTVIEKNFF